MADLERIKENVAKMASQNAPEADIDGYISSEGVTIDDVKNFTGRTWGEFAQEKLTPDMQTLPAAVAGGADMALFGFADELKSMALAGVRSGLDPQVSYEKAYDHFVNKTRQKQEELQQENPLAYGAGQVAGAIATPLMASKTAIGKGLATGVSNAASKGFVPALGATTGLGVASGGLYGVGSGTTPEERAGMGLVYGGFGGIGGSAGTMVSSIAQRAANIFARKNAAKALAKNATAPTSNVAINKDSLPTTVGKGSGDVFLKTKGQRTQLPKQQRLESEAMAGLHGDASERVMRSAAISQSRERKGFVGKLGDIERAGDANNVLEDVFSVIQNQSSKLQGKVDNAYDLAREGGGTKISTDDIKDGLFASIMQKKRDNQYNISNMPQAQIIAKDLSRLVRKTSGGRYTTANLSTMEGFRTRITNAVNSSSDRTEKRFLRDMRSTYDDFMYKTANEAVDVGDEKAIMTFRDAVSKRALYGRMYEEDNFIDGVVTGDIGIDDAIKDLIGTGSIVGKKGMEKKYDALLVAAGDDSPQVISDMQSAYAKKILKQAISGVEAGGVNDFYSPAKLSSALEGLFVNNRNFAIKLYGKEVTDNAQKAIKELNLIKSTQPSTGNVSGSGELVLRALDRSGLGLISNGLRATGNAVKSSKVKKSVLSAIEEVPEFMPKSKIFGAIVGGEVIPTIAKNIKELNNE